MPMLTCQQVRFFSQADEAAFFHFVVSIKAVRRVEGGGDSILLHVCSRPSRESMRDLEALFQRYHISNEGQLRQFSTLRA